MTANEKQNKTPVPEKKELTPKELQQRKKILVFPLFFLAFAGCMWLIFAPDGANREESAAGFNTELPIPESDSIVADKRDAYTQGEFIKQQEEKMRSLQDFVFEMNEGTHADESERTPAFSVNDDSSESRSHTAFQLSRNAYADINRQVDNFYEETLAEEDKEKDDMQARIEELEHRLEEAQTGKTAQEEQIALLEKSYEIAARYMNGGQEQQTAQKATVLSSSGSDKTHARPVRQVQHNVVSRLAAPISDSAFRAEYTQPRNWSFYSIEDANRQSIRNTIRACIYRTVTITDGGEVMLRIQEPMMAGEVLIPAGTLVTGSARIAGRRLDVSITTIQYDGAIIPVELSVYDIDGCGGIAVPLSDEISAAKEIAANMGSGMSSSITITDDAGSQLLADVGRSAVQGLSQYISEKMREVKITLKAGYHVFLVPPLE